MIESSRVIKTFPYLLAGAFVISGLYASSLYSYLLFHTLVELFNVLTAFAIFALAWNTRKINDNHYLLFIGIASLFTGALDLLHTLTYKGMGIFPAYGANLATELWIAFRFLFGISFLAAAFFIEKKPSISKIFSLYAVVLLSLITAIFADWFPDCFIEGAGLTQFKIVSEYIICLIFLASLTVLILKRRAFDRKVLWLIILSHIFSIAAELSFTQYVSVYGFSNMLGHLFLLASVTCIYQAIIVTGLTQPSRLLFRNLKQSEEAIRASETKYRLLFQNMANGFAYHRIVTDEKSRPIDYIFLEVNDAFEAITGLKRAAIIKKGVREVLPGIEKDPADWIGRYGTVALSGQEIRFEQYAGPLGKWYSISAYSPFKEHFVTIVEDITQRKLIEKELSQVRDELEARVKERTSELVLANEELEQEVRVRWLAEKELRKSEERFRTSIESLLDGFAVFSAVRDTGKIVDFRYEYINEAGCQLNNKTREEQLGRTLLELLPAHSDSHLFKEYVSVVETGKPFAKSQVLEEMYGDDRQLGRAFDFQAVKLGDGFAVVWRDVSERRETERRITLMNRLLKLYTLKFSRKEYLDVAVEFIRSWTGCRHTGVRIADSEGNIPYESCVGYDKNFLSSESQLSIKDDRCICTRVVAGRPGSSELGAMTPNGSFYSNDSLAFMGNITGSEQGQYRGICMGRGYKSLALVPIRHGDTILGAIHVADEREGMVPLKNVEFIEQLAFIIGEALFRFGMEQDLIRKSEELSRMNEQLRNLSAYVDGVREEERTSIAREIHDELGQILTAVKMDVSWIRRRLWKRQNALMEKAGDMLQIIDGAIKTVKRISAELRPGILDDIGLPAAIEWAVKDFEKRTGITCAVSVGPETVIIDRTRSTALFRILQESLTNIMRHAHASRVSVLLEEKSGTIDLTVNDNGKGIRKEEMDAPHSFGLIGMRERVQFLGGEVSITGALNKGTFIKVSMPIQAAKETGD